MAALDFPSGPSIGQTFTGNGKIWTWDGVSWNVTSTNLTLVAGSNQQVQFNDAGVLGAHSGFIYNKTNSTATLGNLTLSAIAAASVGTDSFVVSDAGVLKYRTAAQVRTEIGAEPTITAGTTSQYYRGDKSWQTLNLQNVTSIGATTNQPITLTNTAGSYSVQISVDSSGNIIFSAGVNQNFHFSGDVVAFSSLTPAPASWWNSMPVASATTLGGVKIGSGLTITSGVLSVTSSGGGTWGSITGILSSQTDLQSALDGKEATITAGTTSQYWRGDKSWQTLNTTAVTEGTNLYYTDTRSRSAISLTTTGTSGAASYNSSTGVLNIPQYQSVLTNPVTGTGTSGYVTYWNGSTSVTGVSNLFWDNTNTRLGIGNSTPGYTLHVSGAIYATGEISAYSDERKKENIKPITDAVVLLEKIRGVYYNKTDDASKKRLIGVIAQEVNKVIPELVTYTDVTDDYGVMYGNFAGLFIEAIKEQQRLIEDLYKEINLLKQF